MMPQTSLRILAGDIGGTNTRLSLWTADDAQGDGLRQIGEPAKFKNAGTRSLDDILKHYLASLKLDAPLTDACFGVAGPVDGRRVQMTNIRAWPTVDADALADRLNIDTARRVNLINDMPAHAASLSAVADVRPDACLPLRQGTARRTGTQAIVMPGTGLGIGASVWDERGSLHRPIPTEAGHADLPTRDRVTTELVESMRRFHPESSGIVTREHVISGPGLRAIYACLARPSDPTLDGVPPAETFKDREATDPIARQTLDIFARLLGELCGCVAFDYLATGGIFLAGSIATSLRDRLAGPPFDDAFTRSGPPNLRPLIAGVPVTLVTYADTGLLGAATYATWAAAGRV